MNKKTLEKIKKKRRKDTNRLTNRESRIVRNCLLILKIINDGHKVNRDDMAQICGGVCRRTVDRYLAVLRDVGYEIYYNRHHGCYEIKNKEKVNLSYLY